MNFQKPRCNCPDSLNKKGAIPGSRTFSLQFPSDWSINFQGIKTKSQGYCLHEIAVLRVRKDLEKAFPSGIPNDLPVPVPEKLQKRKDNNYKLQNPSFLGDDFS